MSTELLYQEILPKAELKSSLPQPKEIPHSVVTAENAFYQTSLHLQQQWKEDCMPSGHPKPFQTFHHFEQWTQNFTIIRLDKETQTWKDMGVAELEFMQYKASYIARHTKGLVDSVFSHA